MLLPLATNHNAAFIVSENFKKWNLSSEWLLWATRKIVSTRRAQIFYHFLLIYINNKESCFLPADGSLNPTSHTAAMSVEDLGYASSRTPSPKESVNTIKPIDLDNLQFQKLLGKGSYGKVSGQNFKV